MTRIAILEQRPDEVEELVEATWSQRERRLPRHELLFEAAITVVLVAACVALSSVAPPPATSMLGLATLFIGYAVATRVRYPLGAGNVVPTEPFLIAFFALAPPAAVPLLVCGALACGTIIDALARRTHVERVAFAGGDAFHAIGPAAVLYLAGADRITDASVLVVVGALAAQAGLDLASSSVREWVAAGVRPQLQARVISQIFAVDLTLAPLGFLAAFALASAPWAPLALLPLVGLLGYTAQERLRGVERAHDRLVALQHERSRLRVAVGRVGEAFASSLDLDALFNVVTRVAVEALDAEGSRTTLVGAREARVAHSEREGDDGAADSVLLAGAEARARAGEQLVRSSSAAGHALACRIANGDELLAILTVFRRDKPFHDEDAALMQYLCDQAAVAAANVLRHETLHLQATIDEMTGLANHRRFQEVLGEAVDRYAREQIPSALILLDLDNFKQLNDRHGHQFGDMVLQRVGQCLREETRDGDEPARYGGEELAVIVHDSNAAVARDVAERIRRSVAAFNLVAPDGQPVPVTLSAGVAELDAVHPTKETLVRAADSALYAAKRHGRNRVIVAGEDHEAVDEAGSTPGADHASPSALRRALLGDELRLNYQPIAETGSGRVVAVEALVRWQHPERGLVPPAEFLATAEKDGLMPALGRWVLERACSQAAEWLEEWPGLSLTVNVAPHELAQGDFADDVARVLHLSGLPADALILELTETTALHGISEAAKQLARMRERGVRIAIDDFGTGYSGLDHLLSLPVDIVKIPRQYIARLDGPVPRDRTLCEGLIGLVQSVGLGVVAEGVERPEQRDALQALGVPLIQGFHLAGPLTPDALAEWLVARRVVGDDEVDHPWLARSAPLEPVPAARAARLAASG